MPDQSDELNASVSELDDGYLKVLLLLTVRLATNEEPRRAGFWHGLAGILSAEQEKRRGVAEFRQDESAALEPSEISELEAVIAELRRDVETLEAEYRESYGDTPPAGGA